MSRTAPAGPREPHPSSDHRHDHPLAASVGAAHAHAHGLADERRLLLVLLLTGGYLLVQAATGLLAGSLALLADAGHMLTDVLGLGMTLAAIRFARRPATPARTYGFYRAEILAALANSLLLLGIAAFVLLEAWQRLREPREVAGLPMLVVAVGGLLVNAWGAYALHGGAQHSLSMQGAFLEVVSDLLGSLAAILAALVITTTGWWQADPLLSVGIGLLILPRTWRLLRSALDVLLESTPRDIAVAEVEEAMRAVPGVEAVHDLHVWTITSGFVAMSGHVEARGRPSGAVMHDVQDVLRERFGIRHTTLQVEQCDHAGDVACCTVDPRCLVVGGYGYPLGSAEG